MMPAFEAIPALNRLFGLLCRSLPAYLESARPWSRPDEARGRTALARLIADQQALARRVAEAIIENHGTPDPGPFPLEFAALNDVSLDYLLGQILDRARSDVEAVEHCVAELAIVPSARRLAEEVLGNLQGHIDQIAQL